MKSKLITIKNPKSLISEAYRSIRTNLDFLSFDKNIKIVAFTSSEASEGKTTTVCNMAEVMNQAGKNVLVIDCDLRKPTVHSVYDLKNTNGLTNYLSGGNDLQQIIQLTDTGINIISSGPIPPNPSELLNSNKMKQMLDLVSSTFDVILIDTPPINIVTDATIMARMVDGVVLIIAANCTRIEKAIHAKSLLEKVDAHLLGVILNRKKIKKKQYYTDYSYLEENETSRIKKRKPCRRSKKFT